MDIRGPYRVGAAFLLLSAALHILAPLVGGLVSPMMFLALVGLVYLIMALGLFNGWRWLAYVAFLVMLVGGIVAIGSVWSGGPLPIWWWLLIAVADWLGALALFAVLWRSAPKDLA